MDYIIPFSGVFAATCLIKFNGLVQPKQKRYISQCKYQQSLTFKNFISRLYALLWAKNSETNHSNECKYRSFDCVPHGVVSFGSGCRM